MLRPIVGVGFDLPFLSKFFLSNRQEILSNNIAAYVDKTSSFGVDIDTKTWDIVVATCRACERYGKVDTFQTEHGWHFKVTLPKGEEIPLFDAFWARYKCGDDHHRLLRDMLKVGAGGKVQDVLFDLKTVKRKSILKE